MEPLNLWMRFACLVAGADQDLIRRANHMDRMTVGSNAVILLLVGTFAVFVWTLFFWSFAPAFIAIPLGFLVGSIVFMVDRAMSSSDWDMAGVLRVGRPGLGWWAKLVLRLSLAYVLASSTAVGAVLYFFSQAIDQRLQMDRLAMNRPLQEEYALLKKDAKGLILSPVEGELSALKTERARMQTALSDREKTIVDAHSRAASSRVEANREKNGDLKGYKKGEGTLFLEAQRQEQEVARSMELAAKDADRYTKRFDQLGPQVTAKMAELSEARAAFVKEEARIDEEMSRDPRWNPVRTDPLVRWLGLEALRKDPKTGTTVSRVELGANITLMTIELMFLLIKMFFTPASVYTLMLVRRTKQAAASETHAYRQFMNKLRGGTPSDNAEGPSMRIVDPSQNDRDPDSNNRQG